MAINAIKGFFPDGVEAFFTDRLKGVSQGPYRGFNLGSHVGDVPSRVAYNRYLLQRACGFERQPLWLNQVHGTAVQQDAYPVLDCADAAVTQELGLPLAIMTADCLPVLFASRDGSVIGAAHAGWRGLAGGVLEATVEKLAVAPTTLLAWLGPCIGAGAFEVGSEVREAFIRQHPDDGAAFKAGRGDKYLADLQQLAANRLQRLGLVEMAREPACTFDDAKHYFSYRREAVTGRMAFVICRKS